MTYDPFERRARLQQAAEAHGGAREPAKTWPGRGLGPYRPPRPRRRPPSGRTKAPGGPGNDYRRQGSCSRSPAHFRLPVSSITVNPRQREHFDEQALAELAESIGIVGPCSRSSSEGAVGR